MPGGCKQVGPGPNAYLLPSTVGYHGHDSTRDRRPAYSMGRRQGQDVKSLGPGPDCMVDKYNRFGRTDGPSYTMAPQLAPLWGSGWTTPSRTARPAPRTTVPPGWT
ncbi:outer dense fiber protein 3-like protein 2 [Frankliniella occidentalis]|uniref:Outer dense fiber protein 3-like protein 2 n=1 Tax=Frankliniella occidentalis TaxID=133901 RepID=A0A9C6WW47_FRAOC|nr:outer dense fiber protein 3-like protein 2 [Frankliniella occidentalis]